MGQKKKTISMRKLKIAVLMGGKSPEYDVSLASGKQVCLNLDQDKYEVFPVIISPDGQKWLQKDLVWLRRIDLGIRKLPPELRKKERKTSFFELPIKIKPTPDLFFLAVHGPFGEDGTLQGMLDFLGFRYTGSGVLASALGMNKIIFKKVMASLGIKMPESLIVEPGEEVFLDRLKLPGSPWVVKPSNQGSSVGVTLVKDKRHLKKALDVALKYDQRAIIEEFIPGKEVSCGVLGNGQPFALPVIEICPKKDFFDYEAKYSSGMCKEIVPARLSPKATRAVQDLAVKVFKGIGAKGFARVDMIVSKNVPYVLEINTIPGLTPASLLPKEAEAVGISYPKLLDLIIKFSLQS